MTRTETGDGAGLGHVVAAAGATAAAVAAESVAATSPVVRSVASLLSVREAFKGVPSGS